MSLSCIIESRANLHNTTIPGMSNINQSDLDANIRLSFRMTFAYRMASHYVQY